MGIHVRERADLVPEYVMVERQSLRARAEDAVERLLALLDELDGDPDCEPDVDGEDEIDHLGEWGRSK